MGNSSHIFDAVVIGGGPGGSTVATVLAKAGRKVIVLEKDTFPRFHIGESLLAATLPILERLDMHHVISEQFIRKGGGKWFYGPAGVRPVRGDFSRPDQQASFKDFPHSYMVERSRFDELLLDNSRNCGADVRFRHHVTDLIYEGHRVVGVCANDETGEKANFYGKLVFDCSGLGAVVANKLRIRRPNQFNKRMAIYAHYRATALDDELKEGWFVGQMIYDGWSWLIPLSEELISVGVVVGIDHFKQAEESPAAFLEQMMKTHELFRTAIAQDAERVSDVRVSRNVANTSDQIVGDGWVLVGDAAFFIDPCYSSGVHVAIQSGELAGHAFLKCCQTGDFSAQNLRHYEEELKKHERAVTTMVDAFYIATRNPVVQRVVAWGHHASKRRTAKFVTFAGGDFSKNTSFIAGLLRLSRVLDLFTPVAWKERRLRSQTTREVSSSYGGGLEPSNSAGMPSETLEEVK